MKGVSIIGSRAVKRLEQNVECRAALYSPRDGIIDAASYLAALEKAAVEAGVVILKKSRIVRIEPAGGCFATSVDAPDEAYDFMADAIVNAAGLYAEEIAAMLGSAGIFQRQLLRGEYCLFNSAKRKELFFNGSVVDPVPQFLEEDGKSI